MFRYSDELIEEIRINNDIVEVVSEYIRLEKKGKNYFGLCPFHKEKTPSFSVEPQKQFFYCYGCGKGGNVFQFISLIEKLDFTEALKLLADRARIPLPEGDDGEQAEKARQRQDIIKINLAAARFFYENLNSNAGTEARKYLLNRGISEHTIRKFGMGYSSADWDGVYKLLKSSGFSDELILKSGLALRGKNGGVYDRFRQRVMYPIFDVRGNILGFGGRVMDSSLPKYMNSPETMVYNKGKNLYALNFAKNAGEKRIVVVEGYMDAITLHQGGINYAVASLGTALTESQGRLLKKYADEVVISYDSDSAGQAATLRGLDILRDIGCNVKVLTVPDGKDPDEYIRKNGPEGYKRLIEKAISLVEYKIRTLKKELDTGSTDGRIAFLNKTAEVLSRIENNVEREMYIKKIADEYEISEEAMYGEVLKKSPKAAIGARRSAGQENARLKATASKDDIDAKILHDERFILSLLCTDNSIARKLDKKLTPELFSDNENRQLAETILARIAENREISAAELMNLVSSECAGDFARIINEECHCDDNIRAIMGKIRNIDLYKTEKRQKQILELLRDENNLPEGDVDKLKLEFKDLSLKIRDIKNL